jgi:hypothetical protein
MSGAILPLPQYAFRISRTTSFFSREFREICEFLPDREKILNRRRYTLSNKEIIYTW